jgi:hypothetical protein
MLNTKNNFIDSVSYQFRVSSNWRKAQAKRFPHDARNAEAATRLLELESEIVVPDDAWALIEPHFNGGDARYLAAVTETNREVGFRRHPRDFAAWLENLHDNLTSN